MLTRSKSIFEHTPKGVGVVGYVWICDRDEGDIEATLDRYLEAIHEQQEPADLVVINNGLAASVSERIVAQLEDASISSSLIRFGVRCPESTALSVAFRQTKGDVIVLLPAYPQSDPSDISRMLQAIRDGSDYVASWRTSRVDSPTEQRRSRFFNAVTQWFSGLKLHDINSGLRVMRREVVADLPLYGDLHVYLPILAARQGFEVGEVPVKHVEERPGPDGGRGISVYLRRALDLLTLFFLIRFTQKPFRFFGGIGTGLLATGGFVNLVLAAQKVLWHQNIADRPLLVLGTLLMVLGIQMFSLGLIGELIIFVNAGGVRDYQIDQIYETDLEGQRAVDLSAEHA